MVDVLIDTNVLVYAHDRGEPIKQKQAIALLTSLQLTSRGCVSTQTLAEFFHATTRGQKPILSLDVASRQFDLFSQSWPILTVTMPVIATAVMGVREHRLSYYDAQLWATALLNQVPFILSEDFASGRKLGGVSLINPFAGDFKLADWA